MTINKEAFMDLKEKYEKALKLLRDSKSDPDNEPYTSKYSARQILIGMKANIEKLIANQQPEASENIKLIAMNGVVYLYLGMVAIDTEEISMGEKHLEKCNEIVDKYKMLPEMIMIVLNMLNQFGILWSSRDFEKAKLYLEKAEKLYYDFKATEKTPIDISDLFNSNAESCNTENSLVNFEKTHTLTLYYLAQIFGKLKEEFKSAIYCHITLQRQLDMDDYECIDWALNSATLSQFFMGKYGLKQARHHLAASSYILDKYKREELVMGSESNEEFEAKLETFNHRSADVARCWLKYGIFLLEKSKEKLLAHTENIDEKCELISDLSRMGLSDGLKVTQDDLNNLSFKNIDVSYYENQITDQFVLHLSDAKKVFLTTLDWIKKAQDYYKLDTLASDHIEIIQDQSELYLNLLFFDDNQDNQAKLYKRRIDLLENIINNVNSQYYMNYCRQIWFDLGQSYSEIIDIKSDKLKENEERPKPQALNKINNLVEKSIAHFTSFVDSFKINIDERQKINDENERSFLRAYFHIAALYGRYITLDKVAQLKNIEKQYEYHKFITEYCEKYSSASELIPMELSICKEMVMLLPVKIIRLKAQICTA